MQGQSEALDEWLDAIVDRYFYSSSWPKMVIKSGTVDMPVIARAERDACFDVKCGLDALNVRYPFIQYKAHCLTLHRVYGIFLVIVGKVMVIR